MSILIEVVLPVFIVLAFGYVAVWTGYISDAVVSGLMKFAQGFALPLVLFKGVAGLDIGQYYDWALLGTYYTGAIGGFVVGMLGARYIFDRNWQDSVAIGFVGLFSNSLLLGLPITERAYGTEALQPNYAIISIHAPICYAIGITAMEIVKNRGHAALTLVPKVIGAIFKNALIIGITAGFVVNLTGFVMPQALSSAVDLVAKAGLPTALFALGGVLYRYRPEGDMRVILFIVAVSLGLHPTVVWFLGHWTGLATPELRSAVITGAMAPGVNAYLFADMYGSARRVAASAVLIGTALSILTAAFWLSILP